MFKGSAKEVELYHLDWASTQPRTSFFGDQTSIRIEINPYVLVTQKTLHSFLDLMRDVGGLAFLLMLIAAFCNQIFTYNKLENALVE